jgi:eukaryotic-like serine/threonine-protein kinase
MPEPQFCTSCGDPMSEGSDVAICPSCVSDPSRVVRVEDVGLPISAVHPDTATPTGPRAAFSKRIGDYELHQEIARGGMGIIYRARQVSLNRWVALKFIRVGELATEHEIKRFKIEAEAVATLDHPNIVPVFETGETEGLPYFSMRLIEGTDLAHEAHRYRRDQKAAAELIATLARAVHHAHERGILHRDLKPSNVILDSQGRPFLTDFGLAKRVNLDSDLTLSGAIVGTPNYMAPEQAAGKASEVTTAADVYSLGALLYHLLTGEPPFRASTPAETLRQVVEQDPARPASADRNVDHDLETICLKCLEKNARGRYPSALALAEDLERWLRCEPIQAKPASAWTASVKWCRRRPASAALLAVSGTALLAVFTILLVGQKRLRTERDYAQAKGREAAASLEVAERHRYVATIRAAAARMEANDAAGVARMLDDCQVDLRSWEWGYLQSKLVRPAWRRKAHLQSIRVLLETSDPPGLITSGDDHLVRAWDLTTGSERWHYWTEHPFQYLTTSRNGEQLFAGSNSGDLFCGFRLPMAGWRIPRSRRASPP